MKSLSALLIFAATSVFAETPNVAVVDIIEVMAKYNKAIEIKAGLDKSLEASRAALGERTKEFEQMKADLESTLKRANEPTLNEAGKKTIQGEVKLKAEALQQRQSDFQQFLQSANGQLQQRANQFEQNIIADIRVETDKLAKAKNIQLIIPKNGVLTVDSSLDITAEIIKNLNANYKSGSAAEAEKPAAK